MLTSKASACNVTPIGSGFVAFKMMWKVALGVYKRKEEVIREEKQLEEKRSGSKRGEKGSEEKRIKVVRRGSIRGEKRRDDESDCTW